MTDIDLDDLRKKALASADYGDDWYSEGELLVRLDGAVTDSKFVAAANPTTVLALIERLEEAERERDALVEKVRQVRRRLAARLEDAWDDGNAMGLDGWVGPEQGTKPDEEAIRRREQIVDRLWDETLYGTEGGGRQ